MNTTKSKDQMRTLFLIDSLLLRMAFKTNWQALLNSLESLMTFSEIWVYFFKHLFFGRNKASSLVKIIILCSYNIYVCYTCISYDFALNNYIYIRALERM